MEGKPSSSRTVIRGRSFSFQNLNEAIQVNNGVNNGQELSHPVNGATVASNAQIFENCHVSIQVNNGQQLPHPINGATVSSNAQSSHNRHEFMQTSNGQQSPHPVNGFTVASSAQNLQTRHESTQVHNRQQLALNGFTVASSAQNRQESMQVNSGQQLPHPFSGFTSNAQARDAFPIPNRNTQNPDGPISFIDCHGKADVAMNTCDENNCHAVDGNNENEEEKKDQLPWQRVRWTDQMVKLLITILSYLGEDPNASSERKTSTLLPKKGKWRAVSKVMSERGCHVSPQQCEDKFNDLNKRYKKLNDMLGRGICCDVVENPALMDSMGFSDKKKEIVRKILNSKQLFYQEMCSYRNGNRLHLPHDQALQESLHLALKSGESNLDVHEEENFANDCPIGDKRKKPQEDEWKGEKWYASRSHELKEKRLAIEVEMLELENQRLRWIRQNEIEDEELEMIKLENEQLKLDNVRLALEIKRREMGGGGK